MGIFLLDILKIMIGIVLGLSAKEALVWLKEWWRKRNINPIAVDVERRRKEAGLVIKENER